MEQNQLGSKIRELRVEHSLTQAELGKAVGVSMQAVSKWERGGTPDIGVLLPLAEYFNVSLDELFGRKLDNTEKLEDTLYYSVLQMTGKQKFEQATNYCWAIFKGLSDVPDMQDVECGTTSVHNMENTRGRIFTEHGIGYFLSTQEARLVAIMPEPEDGFNVALGSLEEYTMLFQFLSDPDAMKLFLFLCTRPQTIFSPQVAIQETGIGEERVKEVFDRFEQMGWIAKEQADMGESTVTLYRPTYKEYFLFFLFFARELLISPRFWYISNCMHRSAPLLRQMPGND